MAKPKGARSRRVQPTPPSTMWAEVALAARLCRCSTDRIRELCDNGTLPSIRTLGGTRLVDLRDAYLLNDFKPVLHKYDKTKQKKGR